MSKKLTMGLVLFISLMLVVGFCSGNVFAEKTYKLVWQISAPSGTPYMTCANDLAQRIKEATSGRLTINVNAGNSITSSHEVTDAVRHGVLDCASPNPSMDLGRFGEKVLLLGASGFPAGPTAAEFLAWAYMGDGLKYANEIYNPYGCVVIGWVTASPPELFCHSNKPLKNIEDFKGVKFRTMGLWGDILKDLGASVVTVSGGEIYETMDRGVIDAFEYCGAGVDWASGFQEIGEYIGVPGIHSPLSSNVFIVNEQAWNDLPEDLQNVVKDEVRSASFLDYLKFGWEDALGYQKFLEYGTKVFTVSDEAQKEIAKRSYEKCLEYSKKDSKFKEIFENQRDFINKWKAIMDIQQPKYNIFEFSK